VFFRNGVKFPLSKLKTVSFGIFNLLFLIFLTPTILLAKNENGITHPNDVLKYETGKQIKEVLDVWILIGSSAMILVIIAGAAILVLSGTNPRMRTVGKTTVLGAGLTITLLLSTYVIVQLFLKLFGLSLF
jgi:hypothetical protein